MNIGVLMGAIASSTALTPRGIESILPPSFKNDQVWRSSCRRISCLDGGFFKVDSSRLSIARHDLVKNQVILACGHHHNC